MAHPSRVRVLVALAAALLALPPSAPAADGPTGNLVTVEWLQRNLARADVLVLDASPTPVYTAKHIPGATNVDFLTYGFPERPAAELERRFQSWGVSEGKTIVIYDQGGNMMATRLFFDLYYHGFPAGDLLLLDGGLAKWEEKGLPVTSELPAPAAKGSFRITKTNGDVRVRLPEVLAASGDPDRQVLLEALSPGWHFGEVMAFDKAGHIPNAVLLPSADFYNPDKTFKSPAEIKRMLDYLGIGPDQRIHTHCGGGVAASVPFFALKFILKYPSVTLFTESQMGWLADGRDLPYWTYDAPFLMRRTDWLQAWGGQMMRMYGNAQVSIVDVRPTAAYQASHVPFALNVPAAEFKQHAAAPETLAKTLGAAGVNPAHEAVVVSGAGLTPEAALAFVLLEKLGQRKVSVFVDSLDEWTRRGFKLAAQGTAAPAAPAATPGGLASQAPAGGYAQNPREGIILTNPGSTKGLYPKVFVASGSALPAKVPEGTVVHVPYSSLLGTDGTPKPAKEIWKQLSTAGVPRYAELVCFADDPGEAAVTYFVLRLMGYPDVKVLLP